MKKLKLLITLLMISTISTGQYDIETDIIRARVEPDGLLFNNSTNSLGGFEAPIDSGLHTFFAYNFWVSGLVDDSVYFYGTRFLQLSDERRYGPMMDEEYYDTEPEKWDRVWNISRAKIDNHIEHYDDDGYVMPEVIENWPGNGDVSKGQANRLAPFIDINDNGVYEPELGEYPETIGDEAIYLIYNGERNNDVPSSMGIETHVMVYVFNCDDFITSSAVFAYVKQINRSANDYQQSYLGYFSDFDIGTPFDDYSVTDVNRSTTYGINGDDFDEESFSGPGYGYVLPAQGVTILRGVKQDIDEMDNAVGISEKESVNGMGFGDGIVDNEYRGLDFSLKIQNSGGPTGDPQIATDYYKSMNGIWRDGTTQLYGGDGYSENTSEVVSRFGQSENDPLLYGTYGIDPGSFTWDPGTPGDTRMIGSSGPFTFESGTYRDMYMAFTFARHGVGSDTSVADMKGYIDEYIMYYQNNLEFCGSPIFLGINEQRVEKEEIIVYPNPFSNEISLNYEGNDPKAFIAVYDLLGREVYTQNVINGLNVLNLNNISAGTFILKLSDATGTRIQKIVRKPN